MTLDLQFVAAVVGAGMLGGMLNTLVSSGSASSLPTLMFIELSPTMANGTDRLAIVVGAATRCSGSSGSDTCSGTRH